MTLAKLNLRPEKSTYKYTVNRDVVSTQLEGGLSRRRRDIAGSSAVVNCTWFLQPFQYQYFMAFYQLETVRGSNSFLIDLLLEQPYLEEMKANFVEQTLTMQQIGLSYQVSADLEVVPLQSDEMAEIILLLYSENDDNYSLQELERLVNVSLEI